MKAIKNNIFKKDGTLTNKHLSALFQICTSEDGVINHSHWVRSGRHMNLVSNFNYLNDISKFFGYKVQYGNNAPKGGQQGDFIKFSKKAQKSLIEKFRTELNNYANTFSTRYNF